MSVPSSATTPPPCFFSVNLAVNISQPFAKSDDLKQASCISVPELPIPPQQIMLPKLISHRVDFMVVPVSVMSIWGMGSHSRLLSFRLIMRVMTWPLLKSFEAINTPRWERQQVHQETGSSQNRLLFWHFFWIFYNDKITKTGLRFFNPIQLYSPRHGPGLQPWTSSKAPTHSAPPPDGAGAVQVLFLYILLWPSGPQAGLQGLQGVQLLQPPSTKRARMIKMRICICDR